MRRLLTTIAIILIPTGVWAGDNVLIVGNYGDAGTSIKTELEAVGHTVTEVSSLPGDLTGVNQIWDLRINDAISAADQTAYDTFLQNSGYLYLAGENTSFATRNNSISAFTSTLGGGTITVGGRPSNSQTGNNLYFSTGTTVSFIAAAGIDNTGGTGRVLASDSGGNPTAMIWIGNAGDLAGSYNGTVVVIADINWTQSSYYDAANEQFLEELIAGIVAGTTSGTITATGTGTGVGGSPTVVSTAPGADIMVITSTVGATTTSTSTGYAISENDTHQIFTTTVTTTTSTPTTVTTCTTPTTVTTYSDSTTTTTNGTQTCTSTTTTATTSSDAVNEVTGRIDQMSTITDINRFVARGLNFEGVNAVGQKHDYKNGMEGETVGFSAGHKIINDNNIIFGLGGARLSTDIDDNTNTASADSTAANIILGKRLEEADVEVSITHMDTDYSYTREIGDSKHSATASGKDTTVTATVTRRDEKFQPMLGIARGKRSVEGYAETGPSVTARTVDKDSEYYTYGIVGGRLDLGIPYIEATRYTDGVNTWGVGLSEEKENRIWKIGVERTETKFGTSDRVQLTFEFRW